MAPQEAYGQLIAALRQTTLLGSVGAVLDWDERTQLPARGAQLRASQAAMLARMVHEQFAAPLIGQLLADVERTDVVADPRSDAAANVRETRRSYDRARKLPPSLVEEMAHTAVLSQQNWAQARKASDFAAFLPWLKKTLDLKRQEAQCIGYTSTPYDALLDGYEPGETCANLHRVFADLRPRLVQLVGRIAGSKRQAPRDILRRRFHPAAQETLARTAAAAVGFDFEAGRLDVSVHPFCSTIGPGDTRMTTRYDEHHFADAFFGVLHETGHGLYGQGLRDEDFGAPCGEAISLGIHESQSRLWENLVGRSRSFWTHFLPAARAAFPEALAGVTADQWHFAINDVRPSFIRVEADQATYNLHILLRFELEEAMLAGRLDAADVPDAWNKAMENYLGIRPPDDARGCLQDVHWSAGLLGYFPTYTLGNLYAAQFFAQARRDIGDLDALFARGDFHPLLDWLREKIHRPGKRFTAGQLVQNVTGQPLSADPLMDHLGRIAAELFGV